MGSLPSPQLVEDFLGVLKLYSDGSIYRSTDLVHPKIPLHDDASAVVWTDCLFHPDHNLQLRLYRPTSPPPAGQKLPILFYIHAGGFCFGSRTYPKSHNCCLRLSSALQAVVVSPDHRLAPEHRLPAALDDVYDSLKWLQVQAAQAADDDDDETTSSRGSGGGAEWLREMGDLDRVFVMGDSSGGNLAHHLAVRLGPGSAELAPVRVRGYVLLSPFFGGTVKTTSEEQRPCESFWNLDMYDSLWRLSLPAGATKDHPLANPFQSTTEMKGAALDPMLVVAGGGEILRDRAEEYASRLRENGTNVVYVEFQAQQHGFFTADCFSPEANTLIQTIQHFISLYSAPPSIRSIPPYIRLTGRNDINDVQGTGFQNIN